MNTAKRNIYIGLLTMFMPLVCSLSFTSCSDDYDRQVTGSEIVPMRLSVSANSMGGVSVSRAYNGDKNAEEGEFIHSLCVYVVEKESDTIVKKYCTDTEDEDELLTFTNDEQVLANEGNLLEWTSDGLKLETGKPYIVYAFANWETTWAAYFDTTNWVQVESLDEDTRKNLPWYKLIYGKSVGETITEDDIDFSVDHPAEKIDIDNHFGGGAQYIPMSGRQEITGGISATVELVRLVAKVEMTMKIDISTPDAETDYYYPLQWAALGYFAERVPLFEGGKVHEYMPYWSYVGWPNVFLDNYYYSIANIPVNSDDPYSIDKRYVNETNLDNIPSDINYEYPGFISEWMLYGMLDGDNIPVFGYGNQNLWCYSTIREFKRNEYWTLEHVYSGGQLILTDVINWGNHGEEILDVFEIEEESEGEGN